MPKKADLASGATFTRLTVIAKSRKIGLSGKSYYHCACSCGQQVSVSRSELVTGKTKSCGCLRREIPSNIFKGSPGAVSFNTLYSRCKQGAADRGLEFILTPQEHKSVIELPCHYCGRPPAPFNVYNLKKQVRMTTTAVKDAWISANGIDRFDPSQGYTLANSKPCCAICNYGKLDYSAEDFIVHCYEVVAHQEGLK